MKTNPHTGQSLDEQIEAQHDLLLRLQAGRIDWIDEVAGARRRLESIEDRIRGVGNGLETLKRWKSQE